MILWYLHSLGFSSAASLELENLSVRLLLSFIFSSSPQSRARNILGMYLPTIQTVAAPQKAASREREEGDSRANSPAVSLIVGGSPGDPKTDALPEHLTIRLLWNESLIALLLEMFRFEQKSLSCMRHESSHEATVSCSYFL